MISKTHLRAGLACPAVITFVVALSSPARADFLDDVRRTFQTDIPHFFQDDIPCAFGGQPTSHTKSSCNDHATRHDSNRNLSKKDSGAPPPAAPKPDDPGAPPNPPG